MWNCILLMEKLIKNFISAVKIILLTKTLSKYNQNISLCKYAKYVEDTAKSYQGMLCKKIVLYHSA